MQEADYEALAAALTAPRRGLVTFTGVFNLVLATTFVEANLVRAALPDGLELRKGARVPDGKHPVILMFGTQNKVTTTLAGAPIVLNYHESAFCIPNTGVLGGEQKRVGMFMPRLDVDNVAAAMMGWAVGYEKKLSHIEFAENSFTVRPLLRDKVLYTLTSMLQGGIGKPSAYPNFAPTMDLLTQPIISVDAVGDIIFTVMNWEFETADLTSTQSQLTIVSDGLPAMTPGVYPFDSFAKSVTGTALLQVYWTLKGPFFDWP